MYLCVTSGQPLRLLFPGHSTTNPPGAGSRKRSDRRGAGSRIWPQCLPGQSGGLTPPRRAVCHSHINGFAEKAPAGDERRAPDYDGG